MKTMSSRHGDNASDRLGEKLDHQFRVRVALLLIAIVLNVTNTVLKITLNG